MNNRKSQNSILVLATLGVYLGLVLAGATPQVLAQAALSRQFDVKDEIEVKDDLDKKPDNSLSPIADLAATEINHKITRSVQQFFAKFQTFDSIDSIPASPRTNFGLRQPPRPSTPSQTDNLNVLPPLTQILTVTNLPRAGLDSLLVSDAK